MHFSTLQFLFDMIIFKLSNNNQMFKMQLLSKFHTIQEHEEWDRIRNSIDSYVKPEI